MPKRFWDIRASAEGNGAELLIYGDIGDLRWFGEDLYDVSSKQIAEELRALGDVQEISVRINSPGGNVFSAQAIYSMLKGHSAKVTVYVDGIAASAASMVAMAGDEIVMPANAMMMIHSPMTYTGGNAIQLKKAVEALDKIQETMVSLYARSGQTDDRIREMLEAETWMTGAEAIELGFADRVDDAIEIAASMDGEIAVLASATGEIRFDPTRFKATPQKLFEARTEKKEEAQAVLPAEDQTTEVESMTLEELKAKYPEIFEAAMEAGRVEERARIKAIEEMGVVADGDLGTKAKYEDPCSPEAFAMRMFNAQAEQGKQHQAKIQADAKETPDLAPGAPAGSPEEAEAEEEGIVAAMMSGMEGRRKR